MGRIYELFEEDTDVSEAGDHAHGVEGVHRMGGVPKKDSDFFVAKSAAFHGFERNMLMTDELLDDFLGGHEFGDDSWVTIPEPGLYLLGVCLQIVGDFRGDDHASSERAILISGQHGRVMRRVQVDHL